MLLRRAAKTRAGYDDAIDVVGVHFVGGLVGSLTIGFFANPDFFAGEFKEGLFYGGGLSLLGEQLIANASAIVWSFAITFGIMIVLRNTIGIRVGRRPSPTVWTCPSTPRSPITDRELAELE